MQGVFVLPVDLSLRQTVISVLKIVFSQISVLVNLALGLLVCTYLRPQITVANLAV